MIKYLLSAAECIFYCIEQYIFFLVFRKRKSNGSCIVFTTREYLYDFFLRFLIIFIGTVIILDIFGENNFQASLSIVIGTIGASFVICMCGYFSSSNKLKEAKNQTFLYFYCQYLDEIKTKSIKIVKTH